MEQSLEDLAVHIAAYNSMRWKDLDDAGKEHYRRLAEQELACRRARKELRRFEPPLYFLSLRNY
jgi:hypothetical protein